MERVSKGDIDDAIQQLNESAKALGLERRFEMRYGAASVGISHEILEYHPALSHPTATKIGQEYRPVLAYVTAMRHALQSAKFDRDYARGEVIGLDPIEERPKPFPAPPRDGARWVDPDARSERRSMENAYGFDPTRDG